MSKCPKCGGLAYLGFTKVECATGSCPNFSKKYCDEQAKTGWAAAMLSAKGFIIESRSVPLASHLANGPVTVTFGSPKTASQSLFQVGEQVQYVGQIGDPLYSILAGATGHVTNVSVGGPPTYRVSFVGATGYIGGYVVEEKDLVLSPSLALAGTVKPKFNVGDKVKSTLSYLAGTVTGVTLSPKIEYVVKYQNTPLHFFENELELDVTPPPTTGSLSGGMVGQNTPTPVTNTIVVGSFVYLKATFKRVGIQSCSKGTVVNILYGIPHDTVVVSWPSAPFGNQAPYSRDELELWP